jgi:hypothetical protein
LTEKSDQVNWPRENNFARTGAKAAVPFFQNLLAVGANVLRGLAAGVIIFAAVSLLAQPTCSKEIRIGSSTLTTILKTNGSHCLLLVALAKAGLGFNIPAYQDPKVSRWHFYRTPPDLNGTRDASLFNSTSCDSIRMKITRSFGASGARMRS